MENIIRRKLKENYIKKQIITEEKKIVKNRILSLFEDKSDLKYFNGLSKEKKFLYSVAILQEVSELNKQGLLNEDTSSFMDVLKGLFGNLFPGVMQSAAEPLIKKILGFVGFEPDGFMINFLTSTLTSNPKKLIEAFSDCKVMTTLIAESLVEGYAMMLQQQFKKDSTVYNIIRNTLGGGLKDTNMVKMMEEKIGNTVCSAFSQYSDNAKGLVDKLKNIDSESSSTNTTQPFNFMNWFK